MYCFVNIHFFDQLQNKEELKQKFKVAQKECRCLQEKNKNLDEQNENLKTRLSVILEDNEHYAAQKVRYTCQR